ncbi:chemotaxis-specific protein-glutamate methyltransferase CheB [Elusimicrobiota bacterium]
MKEFIRVLVADDSITARETIIGILESDPQLKVIGEARNGKEAIELVRRLKPDLITMDIKMPIMNGLDAIQHIMAYQPTPIVVIASSAFSQGNAFIFKALEYGALEILEKPEPHDWESLPGMGKKIIKDIKILANTPVITHVKGKRKVHETEKILKGKEEELLSRVIAIGSSTGGPTALMNVLSKLPEDISAGILIVQHIAEGFIEGLVDWLNDRSKIVVKMAEDGETIKPGVAYVAPSGFHLVMKEPREVSLNRKPPVNGLRPAANMLFYSVAEVCKAEAIGVLLTGMGKDGADGMRAIKEEKGITIAQDKKSCLVYGMPKAAVDLGVVDKVVPLISISDELQEIIKK